VHNRVPTALDIAALVHAFTEQIFYAYLFQIYHSVESVDYVGCVWITHIHVAQRAALGHSYEWATLALERDLSSSTEYAQGISESLRQQVYDALRYVA
jgi:hypothetical protein